MNVLILTARYGAGHHSAALALEEEFSRRLIPVQVLDGLSIVPSISYGLSRRYYQFCVERAAWLWGLTFEAMDKADWSRLAKMSFFKQMTDALLGHIRDQRVDLVVTTYPLYNYLLDFIQSKYELNFRHVAVVTDAIEVSRPWVRSGAERIFVTDEYSASLLAERYALSDDVLKVSSFPSFASFYPSESLEVPTASNLRILYAAQAPARQCADELRALLEVYPLAHITVLAGGRLSYLQGELAGFSSSSALRLVARSDEMHELMRNHHLYVGKPGGATMFECYASALPMIVNFALMGQEQGNLDLLQRDQCGVYAQGADAMLDAVDELLANQSKEWKHRRSQMQGLPRRGGAARVCRACEQLFVDSYEGSTS
ncbi:MAG: hypothetical protein R3Y56_00100 [Akkermansia sp.]